MKTKSTKMKQWAIIAFLTLKWPSIMCGQFDSYQQALVSQPDKLVFDGIVVNEKDEVVGLMHKPGLQANSFYLLPFTQGGVLKGYKITTASPYSFYTSKLKAFYHGNRVLFSYAFNALGFVINYDKKNHTYWFKVLDSPAGINRTLKSFTNGPNGGAVLLVGFGWTPQPYGYDILRVISLDENGDFLWKTGVKYSVAGPGDFQLTETAEIASNPTDGTYFLIGSVNVGQAKPQQIIIKLDKDGLPVLWKKIPTHQFEHLYVRADGIFLLGHTTQQVPFSTNTENAILAKLDFDFNPIWVRCYSGESFEYSRATLNFFPDGSMVLGYSTYGAFPTVLAKLNPGGQILGQKGYPLYEPFLDVLSDGSLIMAANSHFDLTGKVFYRPIIAKTDKDGNIDGCETFPACLVAIPTDIVFEPFFLEPFIDPTNINDRPISVDSLDFNFAGFCDIPAPPAPDFFLPDTACLGDSIRTTKTNNIFATAREWAISKNGQTATIPDSLNLGIRFDEPGNYKVSQKTWFLGCEYEQQRTVTVLPALEAKIFPDTVRCEPSPIELKVATNRPVSSLFWENGSPYPTILAAIGERHAVKVSDGICSATDSILVKNFTPSPDFCHAEIYFPNVFSPNGDGLNDTFGPQGQDFEAIKLSVFDRWGNLLFDGPDNWPADRAGNGVYTYRFEYRDFFSKKTAVVTGSITVAK